MRIGYLGGSFDPVHHGHLALAEACREGASLDRVVLVVASRPPHKRDRRLAGSAHRLAMARIACEGNPALAVDDRELRRPGVSYTVDTLRSLLEEHPPDGEDEVVWLLGADSLPELPTWREAKAVVDLVEVVTAARPGHDMQADLQALRPVLGVRRTDRLAAGIVQMPLLQISSTDLRRRVREGRSIRYLVPKEVRRYVLDHGLYSAGG